MILLAVNFPAYVAIGCLVFGSLDAFSNALGYLFDWEIGSWWRGEGPAYEWAHFRLSVFFAASSEVDPGFRTTG